MKARVLSINPNCNVEAKKEFITADNIQEIIPEDIDYVVDAIDTVSAKIGLAVYCEKNKIKLISSMGTGNKLDPTQFKVTDIYKTNNDPLAKIMRRLCKDNKIKKLTVVTSSELPIKTHDRTPGSTPFVPSVAGIFMASHIILEWLKDLEN